MSKWKELAHWMYGDVREEKGFWYSHPLEEAEGLTEEQLLWVPDPYSLCMLWHVGHIAHRERTHVGKFLQGLQDEVIPPHYEVFGTEWQPVEKVRESIDSVQGVFDWVTDVRQKSTEFIASLSDEDFHRVPLKAEFGLSVAHWLFITVAHGAIHIGRIQMLRAMLEAKPDRPC